jgi:hypothetical protein
MSDTATETPVEDAENPVGEGGEGEPETETPVTRQCYYKTAKGVQCKLPFGHEIGEEGKPGTPHRMRALAPAGLPGGFTKPKAEAVPTAEKITTVGRAAERSEDQRGFDTDMIGAWHAWDKAGRSTEFGDMPHFRYVVPPEAVDAVLAMMRLGVGSGSPAKGKKLHYRRAPHVSGGVIVEYAVSNMPEKPVPDSTGEESNKVESGTVNTDENGETAECAECGGLVMPVGHTLHTRRDAENPAPEKSDAENPAPEKSDAELAREAAERVAASGTGRRRGR